MALSTRVITSLKERIKNYLIEHDGLVDPPTQEMFEFAYKQLESSEEIANRVFGKRQKEEVVATVTDAAYYLLRAFFKRSESESCGGGIHNLKKAIHSLGEMVKELEEKFADQLYKPFAAEEEEEDEVVSRDEHKSKMVGLSDQYNHLKERLDVQWATSLKVFSLVGMPGIGKTTLARKIFDDPHIVQHFDCRVWVTVGRKCPSSHVPRRILDQMCVEKGENTGRCLRSLQGKRYLIVLDDAWDRYMVRYLVDFTSNCRGDLWTSCFPREQNGSRILLTSRLHQVSDESSIHMRLMDNEESWHLLREKVFAAESCSSQLERSGRKIAEKCEGLPLTIITVANLLSQQDKTVEYWNEVATRKHHQLYKAAYNEISEVLVSSYNHLPRLLQMWFMFIGVFPQDYEIPVSKLINLCYVDGFLEQHLKNHIAVLEYVMELVFNSMVLVCKRAMYFGYIKTCRLHSSMRHLSNREATRNKFAHVLNIPDDAFGEDIKGQHRLSFHNNVLFSVKEVIKSVEDNCASAHSLFCYGPFLQYQVPICFGLRLLKQLARCSCNSFLRIPNGSTTIS